jgi:hypothetical protein
MKTQLLFVAVCIYFLWILSPVLVEEFYKEGWEGFIIILIAICILAGVMFSMGKSLLEKIEKKLNKKLW